LTNHDIYISSGCKCGKFKASDPWQIITAKEDGGEDGEEEMPALVYVAREKRRAWPHHFKAGALNALVRLFLPLISLACWITFIHAYM
jgi:hypothetical protein